MDSLVLGDRGFEILDQPVSQECERYLMGIGPPGGLLHLLVAGIQPSISYVLYYGGQRKDSCACGGKRRRQEYGGEASAGFLPAGERANALPEVKDNPPSRPGNVHTPATLADPESQTPCLQGQGNP